MTQTKFHRARMPEEKDIYEIRVGDTMYIGSIYFVRHGSDTTYKKIGQEEEENLEIDWNARHIEAAEVLIREKGGRLILDEENRVIAELKTGVQYLEE